jgi:hypothetical protein
MVGVFVRDEYSFDIPDGQSHPDQPPLGFATGYAGIDQDGFIAIADIITISVASGIN